MSAPAGQPTIAYTGANNNQFQNLFQAQPAMGGKGGSSMNTQFRPTQMVTTKMKQEVDAANAAAAKAPLADYNMYNYAGGGSAGDSGDGSDGAGGGDSAGNGGM